MVERKGSGRGRAHETRQEALLNGEQSIKRGTCWTCGSQNRRYKKAAKRFFRQLPKGLRYAPRVIITDKLRSYGAAKRELLPGAEHRQHKRREHASGKLTPTNGATREEDAEIQIGPHKRNALSPR